MKRPACSSRPVLCHHKGTGDSMTGKSTEDQREIKQTSAGKRLMINHIRKYTFVLTYTCVCVCVFMYVYKYTQACIYTEKLLFIRS